MLKVLEPEKLKRDGAWLRVRDLVDYAAPGRAALVTKLRVDEIREMMVDNITDILLANTAVTQPPIVPRRYGKHVILKKGFRLKKNPAEDEPQNEKIIALLFDNLRAKVFYAMRGRDPSELRWGYPNSITAELRLDFTEE